MKRALKYFGYFIGSLVLLVAIAAVTVYTLSSRRLARTYQVAVKPVAIPTDAGSIERGRHIAHTRGCIDCHGGDFAGNLVINDPAVGKIAGTNLTTGGGSAVRTFTDDDWIRAIRHGVGQNGRPLVLMPSLEFSHFSNDDLGALIAYLKTVPAVDRDPIALTVGPIARALILKGDIKLAAEHIDHAELVPPVVVPGVTADYGHYLAAGCMGCHGDQLAGGKIPGAPPDWPSSRNLTPAGDLAKWSEADFLRAMQKGARPDGTKLNPVMPVAFGQMTDVELKALWTYIQALPPVKT